MPNTQLLLQKIEALPPERVGEVEDFVDSLLVQSNENDQSRPATAAVSTEEGTGKIKRKSTLVEFFAKSPLVGSGIMIERIQDEPRNIEL